MKLLFVTDFHVAAQERAILRGVDVRRNAELALAVVEQILDRSDVSLMAMGGDLSHDGSQESYAFLQRKLMSLNIGLVAVPGNHDLVENGYLANFGPWPATVQIGNWAVHLLSSKVPEREYGSLDAATIEYISERLSGHVNNHLLILHHDVFQPGDGHRPGLQNSSHLLRSIAAQPKNHVVLLSGHRHQFACFRTGRITIVNSGAVSFQLDFPHGAPVVTGTAPEFVELELGSDGNVVVSRQLVEG